MLCCPGFSRQLWRAPWGRASKLLRASLCGLGAPLCGLRSAGFGLRSAGFGLHSAGFRLRSAGSALRASGIVSSFAGIVGHGSPWCHGADTARLGLSHEPPVSLSGAIKLQSHVALLCVHPEAPNGGFLAPFPGNKKWRRGRKERKQNKKNPKAAPWKLKQQRL